MVPDARPRRKRRTSVLWRLCVGRGMSAPCAPLAHTRALNPAEQLAACCPRPAAPFFSVRRRGKTRSTVRCVAALRPTLFSLQDRFAAARAPAASYAYRPRLNLSCPTQGVSPGGALLMDCMAQTSAAFALNDTFDTALERLEAYLLSYVSNFLNQVDDQRLFGVQVKIILASGRQQMRVF
jgi:hypothetical protein